MRYLYLDVETTMNEYEDTPANLRNEIVELSFILASNGTVLESYSARIVHETVCTAEAYEIHGIADFMCTTPRDEAIAHLFVALKSADYVCGHNVEFDLGRIRAWNNNAINKQLDRCGIVCTMKDFRKAWKTIFAGKSTKRLYLCQSSLWDCEAYLINNAGYTEETLQRKFREVFPNCDISKHHSSAYDTLLCYLYHEVMLKC